MDKIPWKERRIKAGTIADRKLSADILKVRRKHDSNIREIEKKMEYSAFMVFWCINIAMLILLLFFSGVAHAATLDQWANNIRITEGSPTYGIHIYKNGQICPITPFKARIICKLTVMHKFRQFVASGGNPYDLKGYIFYLADRYCPKSADPIGNRNWKRNMLILMKG